VNSRPTKPVPATTAENAGFWEGAKRGVLTVQRCAACQTHQLYGRLYCRSCGGENLDWVEVSGRGVVFSHTVIRRAPSAAFAEDVPYALALVALAEGPRLMANIVNVDPASVYIGMPVSVVFENRGDVALPQFAPANPQ
jgi:hypothetical protein